MGKLEKDSPKNPYQKPITEIALILDRSGSMEPMRDVAIKMYNQRLKDLREMGEDDKQEIFVTARTFSTVVDDPICVRVPASELKDISDKDYIPDGWTALADAIGVQIMDFEKLGYSSDDNVAFLFLIVTDGIENNSEEYIHVIGDMIKERRRRKNWTFTVLGSEDIDLEKISKTFGIQRGNIAGYSGYSGTSGFSGVGGVMTSCLRSFTSSRLEGNAASGNFYGNNSIVYSNVAKGDDPDDDPDTDL